MPPAPVLDAAQSISIGDLIKRPLLVCPGHGDDFDTTTLSTGFSFHVIPWYEPESDCGVISDVHRRPRIRDADPDLIADCPVDDGTAEGELRD